MIGEPFLKTVARDLLEKFNGELSDITVVFPNNRAKIFFNKYLYECVGKPLWSPSYTTIQSLFQSCSSLNVVDDIKLVCILYEIYEKVLSERLNGTDDEYLLQEDSLDAFYNWGKVLLGDFSDVDDNMVDAKMLFQNIRDTIPFENDQSHLTEEQKQVLKRFFDIFNQEEETKLKRRFMVLWELLGKIYSQFKERLLERGESYEAMMKRDVVERLEKGSVESPEGTFVFVGFNVLNECERRLFKKLKNIGKALFYWDCDDFYMNEHEGKVREAGHFMRQNLAEFGNELHNVSYLEEKRVIKIVGSPTENAQARYVTEFLKNRPENATDDDTVVVLCNESLLLPVLHSIPSEGKDEKEEDKYVNVTMGLPLLQTPIFGLVQILLAYQERLLFLNVKEKDSLLSTTIIPLLRNEYLRKVYGGLVKCDENIRKNNWRYFKYSALVDDSAEYGSLFKRCGTPMELLGWLKEIITNISSLYREENEEIAGEDNYAELYKETLYRIYLTLSKLEGLINEGVLNVELPLMIQLVETSLSSMSVPFTGEQAEGLQVMGFLETRNLDFSNIILLSANENILPKSGSESSFIPYSLRKGYGMTTIEHKNSLYAYYFYRLIQRADNITCMYNVSTESTSKGQMSRFLLQMLVETGYTFERLMIKSDAPKMRQMNLRIEKSADIISRLKEMYDWSDDKKHKIISPSSLNEFLDCPLRFYMKRVLGITRQEEISDEVKVNEFGSVFHKAMENFYGKILEKRTNGMVQISDFPEDMDKDEAFLHTIEECVLKAFGTEYFHVKENDKLPQLSGLQLLSKDAIVRYVKKMLKMDKEYAPFKLIANEMNIRRDFRMDLNDGTSIMVRVGGVIDRVDEKEGVIRILDYKTGGKSHKIETIEELFTIGKSNRYGYGMQVLLYAYLYGLKLKEMGKDLPLQSAVAYVTKSQCADDFVLNIENVKAETVNKYFGELDECLKNTVCRIFDAEEPFVAKKNGNGCRYCDFRSYCGVKESDFF